MNDGGKQRVIGACVLIAVGVLFLPVLLEKSEDQLIDTTSKIPPKPQFELYQHQAPSRPESTEPAPNENEIFLAEQTPTADEPKPSADISDSKPVSAAPRPSSNSKQDTQAGLDASGLPKSWVVQVASFTEQDRASNMVKNLLDSGFRAYSRRAQSGGKTMVRVYVGPSIDRDDALATKKQLDKKLNANTLVVRLSP